ncbi:hypothetical protein ACFLX7_02330 [Chloroflexota bacterium]
MLSILPPVKPSTNKICEVKSIRESKLSLTDDIKGFALDLGYCRAGITTADGFPDYIAELKSRYNQYSFWIESPRRPLDK